MNLNGEIKDKRGKFISFLNYSPSNTFIDDIASGKYAAPWADVKDPVAWVRELRGPI
jgi:hypothetical protein